MLFWFYMPYSKQRERAKLVTIDEQEIKSEKMSLDISPHLLFLFLTILHFARGYRIKIGGLP